MWDAEEGIAHTFSDIEALAKQCKFRDCTHERAPGCAVRRAIQDEELSEERFAAYKKLKAENAYMEDAQNYLAAKKMKFKEIAKYNKRRK
jgi:ribosome biogenesis GTPase